MDITGQRVKELRTEAGLSQADLAAHVGCSSQVISNVERGYTNTTSILIKNLAEYFNVPAGYLLGHSNVKWTADNNGTETVAIGSRIASRMKQIGMDTAALQAKTGLCSAELGDIISGHVRTDTATLAGIARALQTTSDYLLGNSRFATAVLDENEEDMILYYRSMSKQKKRVFMGMLEELMATD